MNDTSNDEANINMQKSSRSSRVLSGPKGTNLFSKVTSTVKFLVRANNQGHQNNPDPVNRKQLLRKQSTQHVMRVAYVGTNGQLNNKALLVTKERLERPINFDNEEDRKIIINIMVKRTHKRHDVEVQFLQKAFRDVGFFQKMEAELDGNSFKKLFAALQLEVCEPGQKLFNIGDIGTKFYIIIQGSVYILLRKDGIVVDQYTKLTETQAMEVEKKRLVLARELKIHAAEDVKQAKVEECHPGMRIIKPLIEGEAFGELALQNTSDRRRTATIVCREKTLLGVLTFEDFRTILGAFYEKKYQEKVNFLQRMDIFQHWRGTQLACLILHMDEIKLSRNHVVFKEGDRSNRLYFLKKGEIELRKQIQIPITQEEEEERMLAETTIGKRKIKVPKRPESMRLAILTEGDYFGESELLANKPRSYTAVASSTEVVLISISRANFMAYVSDFQSMESLKEHIKKKNEWREELIENFIQLHSKPVKPTYHMPKKPSQSLSNIDFTTPKSTKHLDSINSAPKQFNVTSFSKSPNRDSLLQSTVFSKTINRGGRAHTRTLSLSKLEQDSQILKDRDSSMEQYQPKILRFIMNKKGGEKFESAYQKHKRRLAKRQEQEKSKQNDTETGNDEVAAEYGGGKSQSHRVIQATSLNSLTHLDQSCKNEKEQIPTTQSKVLFSLLGGKNLPSKSKLEFSLSGIDSSSYLDPQLTVKAYSTNTLDPTAKIRLSSSINMNQSERPVLPVRLSHNDSIRKSQPCSLNELEVTGSSMPSHPDLDDKQSSTVRFHNKLKKILQVRDTDNPDSTRASTARSRLLDPKAYSSLNDLALGISSKQLTSSPYNMKELREGVNQLSQRKGF